MARAKGGFKTRRRRNKILKQVKGFSFDRRTKFKHASETLKRALHYQYKSRRLLKRDMRSLWITRINAAARDLGTSYSQLMNQLKQSNIAINRKMLAELAATEPQAFAAVVQATK